MGKRIIQQRRGKGSHVYKVRNKAGELRPGYLGDLNGEWKVIKLIPSAGHSTPIAKFINSDGQAFYNFANNLLYVGQEITFGGHNTGDISRIGDLKNGH